MATIDHDALQARYRAERDKRLRPDGNDQYLEPTGRYAHFLDDPWTERVEREPVVREVTVAIIGAGFAGLVTGARLKEAGIDDLCLKQKPQSASHFGGHIAQHACTSLQRQGPAQWFKRKGTKIYGIPKSRRLMQRKRREDGPSRTRRHHRQDGGIAVQFEF